MMFKYNAAILIFSFIAAAASEYPSPMKYFTEEDASKITWAHRVNSVAALTKALGDEDIEMIEADVLMGKVEGKQEITPIMAHPPDTESDLSLEDFIKKIKEHGKKGMKLDFKNLDAVDPSLTIVADQLTDVNIPLFVNGDVLPGPVNETKARVEKEFVTKCKAALPTATLSLGWTTNIPEGYDGKENYAEKYTKEMEALLESNRVDQPVTFPVRAALCRKPHEPLEELVKTGENYTLTVWSVPDDKEYMAYDDLVDLQELIGKEKVYFDMPKDQMEKFRDASKGSAALNMATLSAIVLCLLIAVFV